MARKRRSAFGQFAKTLRRELTEIKGNMRQQYGGSKRKRRT